MYLQWMGMSSVMFGSGWVEVGVDGVGCVAWCLVFQERGKCFNVLEVFALIR